MILLKAKAIKSSISLEWKMIISALSAGAAVILSWMYLKRMSKDDFPSVAGTSHLYIRRNSETSSETKQVEMTQVPKEQTVAGAKMSPRGKETDEITVKFDNDTAVEKGEDDGS